MSDVQSRDVEAMKAAMMVKNVQGCKDTPPLLLCEPLFEPVLEPVLEPLPFPGMESDAVEGARLWKARIMVLACSASP
jgi:hypothetical protein